MINKAAPSPLAPHRNFVQCFRVLGLLLGLVALPVTLAVAGSLDVTWTAPTTNADGTPLTDLASFRVYFKASGAPCPGTSFATVLATSSTPPPSQTVSYRLSGLLGGTSYSVAVTALDSASNEGACSAATASVTAHSSVNVIPSSTLDFGTVNVGSFADQTITVQNTVGGTVSGAVSAPTPFSVVSGSPFTLTGLNSTAPVTVRFTPTSAASTTVNLTVTADGDSVSRVALGGGTGTGPDTVAPALAITTPASGGAYTTTASSLALGGTATDNIGVTQVSWASNRGGSGTASGTTSWTASSIALQTGTNVLTVTARDAAGNAGTATLTVTRATPDTTAPTVSLTAPGSGSTLSASATLTASASDDVAVAGVQFLLDGASLGAEITGTGPYSLPWNTTTVANGSHSLTARARDAAGNTTTSTPVTVSVSNTASSISFVQSNYGAPQSPQATVTVAFPGAQTAGDLNVAVVGWSDATSTVASVTDATGNTYALAAGPTVIAGQRSQAIYYAKNIVGGAGNSITVQFSAAARYPDIRILEYRGLDRVSPVHASTFGSGSSATAGTGTVTTSVPNVLLLAANQVQTSTAGAGSGYTARVLTAPNGDIVQDGIATTAGSYSAAAPLNSSGYWIMQLVAFAGASTAGDATRPTVTIASPTSGGTYASTASTLSLGGTAADNVGVTQVSWANSTGGSGTASGTTAWSTSGITLQPGANVLTVTARDATGNSGTATLTVTYTPSVALTIAKAGSGSGSVTSGPAGVNCGSTCSASYPSGTAVTLTPAAAGTSTFAGWSGGGCSGTGSCIVTVSGATTVTATFALQTYSLSASLGGNGSGTITSAPTGITCGSSCSATYASGSTVTLSAAPTATSTFTGWSGGGCSGTGSCVVTVSAATSVTASFALQTYSLSASLGGNGSGTVTSAPTGITCGASCSATYTVGSVVALTAAPSATSAFTGWSGGGCSGTGPCTVTVSAATAVTANFALRSFSLNATTTGAGSGTITSAPTGITCGASCSATYTSGSVVTLTAAPSASSLFTGWSGGGCAGIGPCTVTVAAATNVAADFALQTFSLDVSPAGVGSGTITSAPSGIACGSTCAAAYAVGSTITLTAAPAGNSTFTGWSGGGCAGLDPCVVTVAAATSVTANFDFQRFSLGVSAAGTGGGTITSTPVGISCGAGCVASFASFASGTAVTLSAVANAGSTFVSWSEGSCPGTGPCVVTVNDAKTVTATFSAPTSALTVRAYGQGTITSAPAGIACNSSCTATYANGTRVTLTADPSANYAFTGWYGGGCSGSATCIVNVANATTVTAVFTLKRFRLR